jgi:hypothetical protein
MKRPKVEYILMCDDIRAEAGSKNSYIGVYGDRILVRAFPYVFPKLCFAISVRPFDLYRTSAVLRYGGKNLVELPEKSLSSKGTGKSNADGPSLGVNIILGFGPIRIEKEGRGEFQITLNGATFSKKFEIKKARNLKVFSSHISGSFE